MKHKDSFNVKVPVPDHNEKEETIVPGETNHLYFFQRRKEKQILCSL